MKRDHCPGCYESCGCNKCNKHGCKECGCHVSKNKERKFLKGRRGQLWVIGISLLFIFYCFNWATWLGGYLQQMGTNMVAVNHISGFNALLFSYLGWWSFLIPLLFWVLVVTFGGN